MSLDLSKVVSQVSGMVARLKAGDRERREHLQNALNTLHDPHCDREKLKRKIANSRTTWLVAGLVEGLDRTYPPSLLPEEFSVVATDGSHIDVDRHRSARCYLINIGAVTLDYGKNPDAMLESIPYLYAEDKDLVIAPPDGRGREQTIEGNLLGIKRSVEECQWLTRLAAGLPEGKPALALLDGSLIMWSLEPYPEFVREALLDKGFLSCLDDIKMLNAKRQIALASYISHPRSTDVVNALRVALCPYEPVDCDRNCAGNKERVCDVLAGVRDSELFSNVLQYGERSAIFANQSSIVEKHYGGHHIYFFYLRLENEIARVEVPQWVATNAELLNLTHSLILDQCERGQGYPVALSEAHEKAVVTGADREQFWALVESSLVEERMPTFASGKSFSKRMRWV